MTGLFRTLTLGDTLGMGVLLALVWLVVRLEWTRSDSVRAHAGINAKLDDLGQRTAALTGKVDRLGEDVAFLRGRQQERDRAG